MSDGGKENRKKSVEEELFRLYTNFEAETSENEDTRQGGNEEDDDIFDAEDSFDLCEDRPDVSENELDFKDGLAENKPRNLSADKYNQFGKEAYENIKEENINSTNVNAGHNYSLGRMSRASGTADSVFENSIGHNPVPNNLESDAAPAAPHDGSSPLLKLSEEVWEENSGKEQSETSIEKDNTSERYSESGKQAAAAFNAETVEAAELADSFPSKQKSTDNAEKESGINKFGNKKNVKRKFNEKLEIKYNKNSILSDGNLREGEGNLQAEKKNNASAKEKKNRFERIIDNYSRSGSSEKLLSDSPYITAGKTPMNMYADFIIAAVPLLIWAVYLYGFRVILVSLVSVLSCVCFELWFEYLVYRRVTVQNLSAVKEGLFLSLLFPAAVPLWIPIVAAFFGTVVIKELFGGLGKNLLNPSLAGFALVSVIFRESAAVFTAPFSYLPLFGAADEVLSGMSGLYPLSSVCGGSLPSGSYAEMIIGQRAGSIGEVSAVLICAGLIYLIMRRVISWQIPISFLVVSIFLYFVFPRHILSYRFTITEMLCGMIPLCAVYFASDFSTAPIFKSGKIIFGAGCGVLTVILRYAGVGIYSTVYAILVMNLAARPIDLYVIPFFAKMFRSGKIRFSRRSISENNK